MPQRELLAKILRDSDDSLVREWVALQRELPELRLELFSEAAMVDEARTFLEHLASGVAQLESTESISLDDEIWRPMRRVLEEVTRSRIRLGWEPSEVAFFLLSLKRPLLERVQRVAEDDFLDQLWFATRVIDQLGVYSTTVLIAAREETIEKQREEMLELSTPVVRLWEGVVALPLIGTLDSHRTLQVMEVLLEEIDRRETRVAILDITGVPTVDSATAQHLLRTTRAAALMGTECVISGIRPATAQTIVSLGIDLGPIQTRASMNGALAYALERCGLEISKR